MKVLLVSEGPHELGHQDDKSSALDQIVRKVLPKEVKIERRRVSDPVVQTVRLKGTHSENYEKRLLSWIHWAQKQAYRAIVLVIDEDGYADRRHGVEHAQVSTVANIPRALGIASGPSTRGCWPMRRRYRELWGRPSSDNRTQRTCGTRKNTSGNFWRRAVPRCNKVQPTRAWQTISIWAGWRIAVATGFVPFWTICGRWSPPNDPEAVLASGAYRKTSRSAAGSLR